MSSLDWIEAKDAILGFLAAGGIYWWGAELHKIRSSMETLNITMASLLERTLHHEQRLQDHNLRLTEIERHRSY